MVVNPWESGEWNKSYKWGAVEKEAAENTSGRGAGWGGGWEGRAGNRMSGSVRGLSLEQSSWGLR